MIKTCMPYDHLKFSGLCNIPPFGAAPGSTLTVRFIGVNGPVEISDVQLGDEITAAGANVPQSLRDAEQAVLDRFG